jgi:hypothetical protein
MLNILFIFFCVGSAEIHRGCVPSGTEAPQHQLANFEPPKRIDPETDRRPDPLPALPAVLGLLPRGVQLETGFLV